MQLKKQLLDCQCDKHGATEKHCLSCHTCDKNGAKKKHSVLSHLRQKRYASATAINLFSPCDNLRQKRCDRNDMRQKRPSTFSALRHKRPFPAYFCLTG